ncbi:hypothetical protein [Mycolicibacterium thermoresistibile]|uniref:Heme peroxidase superfamily protein n=2 Tax=Mycolicibacterium thermoresistibile TaxID=1797 RepID=G7CB02_MYCT3|nr:hypothetical protein [Mycolicibacterium thermoresistibile]EHI14856.1 heme peroxidase superfamily protein [Mycolicibacterium thermoresistibile ATCC 19527]MCV7190825.1 heme peroxidase [Mycolicibacterium thermoresistibile]GAT16198.1 heme peroxidase superfamily protein [Mycolicibacterium thermoresistibile]SNW18664.1 heme peroxidase superfamily protein [Mycolicibacterium thermoresistibile]
MGEADHAGVAALTDACIRELGDPDRWFTPTGYPQSLALCIIDAIYSTGARYSTVENIVRRYREYRAAQDGGADTDGTDELSATIRELGGPRPWATRIGNLRPTSTSPGAPLKAEAVARCAESLTALGIRSTADLRAAAQSAESFDSAKQAWCVIPGQRSGVTWNYALILAQVPAVKADRMVVNFVARALDRPPAKVAPAHAAALVRAVSDNQRWNTIRLDHAIWRRESGRPYQSSEGGEDVREHHVQ